MVSFIVLTEESSYAFTATVHAIPRQLQKDGLNWEIKLEEFVISIYLIYPIFSPFIAFVIYS